jgi:hypothetical protein
MEESGSVQVIREAPKLRDHMDKDPGTLRKLKEKKTRIH